MDLGYYKPYIRWKTTGRSDITALFENPDVFSNLIDDLLKPFEKIEYNKIVVIDAMGFILGGAAILKSRKPLVLVRKEGKLPYKSNRKIKISFKDYSGKTKALEIKKDSINKGDRVLILDEWIETGTQVKAVIKLIECLGGKVVGISAINADRTDKTEVLFKKYNLKPLSAGAKYLYTKN